MATNTGDKQVSATSAGVGAFVGVLILGIGAYFAIQYIEQHMNNNPPPSSSSSRIHPGKLLPISDMKWGTGILDLPLPGPATKELCRDGCMDAGAIGANWSSDNKCSCVQFYNNRDVAQQACWTKDSGATAYIPENYNFSTVQLCKPGITSCPGRVPLDNQAILGPEKQSDDWWSCLDACMTGLQKGTGALMTDNDSCRCLLSDGWNNDRAFGGTCLVPDTTSGGTDLLLLPPDDCARSICAHKSAGTCEAEETHDDACSGNVKHDSNNCAEGAKPVVLMRDSMFSQKCGCRCEFPFLSSNPGVTTMAPV